jgi:hypothetical protein
MISKYIHNQILNKNFFKYQWINKILCRDEDTNIWKIQKNVVSFIYLKPIPLTLITLIHIYIIKLSITKTYYYILGQILFSCIDFRIYLSIGETYFEPLRVRIHIFLSIITLLILKNKYMMTNIFSDYNVVLCRLCKIINVSNNTIEKILIHCSVSSSNKINTKKNNTIQLKKISKYIINKYIINKNILKCCKLFSFYISEIIPVRFCSNIRTIFGV